ncbi:MAG: 1-acyl-sn-glycerol-3-phosphate acyltransferase [Leptospiraceae bacterium]|nr:1-acyl-sn-glycerol-3-phosphate acyltransferase [Leptospiraceae bacterium]MCK6381455.1 1-acyl-sn-glycerol-3-phosphate acyltransferase [Leptospiraceae bacterium]NUM41454.1 1-acyl-sn-glycerol-3-phosphate acyltransferase [Leptospiraceae bacterium]
MFLEDSYSTPVDTPTDWQDYLFLRSRWWLYSRFVKVVFACRKLIDQDQFNNENWAKTSRDILSAVEAVGGRLNVTGIDNLRKAEGPLVIVANHISALETFILPSIVTPIKPVTFVVKEKLMRGIFFGKVMKSRDPVVVGRKNAREDMEVVMREGTRILTEGKSIILFPEGTRQKEFLPENFNTLGVKLAKRAGVGIIPIALKTDFWSNGRFLKGFGPLNRKLPIHIEIGESLKIDKNEKEVQNQILNFIDSRFSKWKKEEIKGNG